MSKKLAPKALAFKDHVVRSIIEKVLVTMKKLGGSVIALVRSLGLFVVVCCGATAADPVRVIMETSLGAITLELNTDEAPATVANFLRYVGQSGYDNTIFHRVIEGFMIQGGGYYRDLSESAAGPSLANEADNGLRNKVGAIAMARMAEIDSATNQFFINVSDNPRLDHQPDSCSREDEVAAAARAERGLFKSKRCKSFGYAVFGRVIDGMSVLNTIEQVATGAQADFFDVPNNPIAILSIRRIP